MTRRREVQARAKREARSARRRDQTRNEILDAACLVVRRDGFAGFTLAAVAQELGLTNPALYYYFNSKEALLFELLLRDWLDCGTSVQAAVDGTENGADAVEAIIRTVFDCYRDRLDMFMLTHQKMVELKGAALGAAELERIRPVNEMLYGGAEARLRADQAAGIFPKGRNPRRFAFTAHMAAIGLLNMKAMTESADDPLIHSDDDLIEDLCQTFRLAATSGKSK